jgi:two-component system, sensor histidine kinase and response regulator
MTAAASLPVKCLIVDDLDDNRLAFSSLLRAPDVQILTARTGAEALELLLQHDDVALALLDVQMPGMDGFELAELMRGSERTRQVPLIFVTAGARDPQRLFKGYDAGAVDFLFKPIEPWLLRSKAQVFFDLYRARQRLDAELRERTETLRLNELFAAVLAHDLRDPLNAMLTSAMLIERQDDAAAQREAARRIVASGTTMRRLIADVLDLSRARLAGGIPLQTAPADLRRVAERVVHEQRTAQPARMIELETAGDLHGTWDADRLGQVLSNLIGNALQHGEPAQPVVLRLDGREATQVRFGVESCGEVPAGLLPVIFDPFRGGERRQRGRGGLGLGLYIVQQIAHAHGGTASVHAPAPGRTEFVVRLPRRA